MKAPLMKIRGPRINPRRIASLNPASRCGSRPVQSRTVACSKTAFTARLVYLRGGEGQEEIGRKGEQESEEESPGQRGGRIEPAADMEHLVDHVDQGAGRQRQEEHI